MTRTLALTMLCLFTGRLASGHFAYGHEEMYDCAVERIYVLSDNGDLRLSNYSNGARGNRFVVSRRTGQIAGSWLTTAKASSSEVLREGDDSEWSFQGLARFDVGKSHSDQVIEIRRWTTG